MSLKGEYGAPLVEGGKRRRFVHVVHDGPLVPGDTIPAFTDPQKLYTVKDVAESRPAKGRWALPQPPTWYRVEIN